MSMIVGTELPGYVRETPSIFIKAFPRDLTPSKKDGCGKTNLNLEALNSKYELASGCVLTNCDRLPLCKLSLSLSIC